MSQFITSFGRAIPFVPGYKAAHTFQSARDVLYGDGDTSYKVSSYGFLKDVFEAMYFLDFLTRAGHSASLGSLLDLGGEEGTVARLLRMSGRAEKGTCLDFRDLSGCLPTDLFVKYVNQFDAERAAILSGKAQQKYEMLASFPALHKEFDYNPFVGRAFHETRFQSSPELDEFLCLDYYTLNRKFDTITAFLCAAWFDFELLISKASECLNPGGIFFMLNDYFWWPINSTAVFGDFPYASQRLIRDDLHRYFKTFHPHEAEDVMIRYDHFHMGKIHPTLSDFIAAAKRHGFDVLRVERLMPSSTNAVRTPFAPPLLQKVKPNPLLDVLDDIHEFRKDVVMEDLMTSFVAMAFRKESGPAIGIADLARHARPFP